MPVPKCVTFSSTASADTEQSAIKVAAAAAVMALQRMDVLLLWASGSRSIRRPEAFHDGNEVRDSAPAHAGPMRSVNARFGPSEVWATPGGLEPPTNSFRRQITAPFTPVHGSA